MRFPIMGIELTTAVLREVQTFMREQELDPDKIRLRVGVSGEGCCGGGYLLDLTDEQRTDDHVFQQDGVSILCDPKSYERLEGASIDFHDGPNGRGFVFKNPKDKAGGCSCGKGGCC